MSVGKDKEQEVRLILRKLQMGGHLPKVTTCHVKFDAQCEIPTLRIIIRRLEMDDVHPVSRLYLIPIVKALIEFAVTMLWKVDVPAVDIQEDPSLTESLEPWRETYESMRHSGAGASLELRTYSDHVKNLKVFGNLKGFASIAKTVDDLVRTAI